MSAILVSGAALLFTGVAAAGDAPARVLITNDNGIDDPKIVALARAFAAARAETWVIAPAQDKSGSGAYLELPRTGSVAVAERDLGAGIRAFAVDGTPGDCVLVALAGLMPDELPDLVVSGINGGPNLGADWMFSGTIGAARVAALGGLPAIAVSGLDDDLPGAVDAAVDWVVRLAAHPAVDALAPGDYLTVSLPRVSPDRIRGARVARRAPIRRIPELSFDAGASRWHLVGMRQVEVDLGTLSDEALHEERWITVVPMRVDELHGERLLRWWSRDPELPPWTRAESE